MKKVSTITLHDDPTTAAKTAGGESNVLLSCVDIVQVHRKLGSVHTLTMPIGTATPFGQAVYDSDYFNEFDTVIVTFDDASIEVWRVDSRRKGHGDGEGITVVCWPYWTMLARRQLRVKREPMGVMDTTLTIYRKTALAAWTEVLSHNAPPHFAVGTVATPLATGLVDIEANNSDHLELLQQICEKLAEYNDGFSAEFEERWNSNVCYIDIVPWVGYSAAEAVAWTADPTSRVIAGPRGGDLANRLLNSETRGASDGYNRIIPTMGPKATPVTIGTAAWMCDNAVFAAGDTTIDLTEDPFGGALDLDADGTIYFGSDEYIDPDDESSGAIGWFPITAINAGTPQQIVVTGDATALEDRRGRFAIDSSGTELVYLSTATAVGDDVYESAQHYENHVPYDNLLEDAGVSTDFSTWSAGLPVGVRKIGAPTVSEALLASEPGYVRHGAKSAKVEATIDEGVDIGFGLLSLITDDVEKLFSFTLNIAVASGHVRVTFIDAEGRAHPQGIEQAESKMKNVRSIMKGGFDTGDGAAYIKVVALEEGTIFYLDSVNVTRSVGPWPYASAQGPRALWKTAREVLTLHAVSRDYYDTKFIDSKYFDAGAEITEVGSYVTIHDAHDGTDYRTSVTGRVRELKEQYSSDSESLQKTVKVLRPKPDFVGRFTEGGVKSIPNVSTGFEQPSDYFLSEFTAVNSGDAVALLTEDLESDEPVRTNELTYSEQLDNGAWTQTRLTSLTANQSLGPDGKMGMELLVANTTNNTHAVTHAKYVGVIKSETWGFTFYTRKKEETWIVAQINDGVGTNGATIYYDLVNGVVGNQVTFGTITVVNKAITVDPVQSDLFRVEVVVTFPAGSPDDIYAKIHTAQSNGVASYAGNGTDGVYAGYAQLEKLASASELISDYIKTVSVPVTRVPGVTELRLTAFEDADYGTELELRLADAGPYTFFLVESIEQGQEDRIVQISSTSPLYTTGNEGDPAFVTNQTEVSLGVRVPALTYIYPPTISLLNRIRQTEASLLLLQSKITNSLSLGQVAVLGESAIGSVTSLANLLVPTRVALRPGWQLTILTARGPQIVNISGTTDIEPGATSIPVVSEGLDAKAGDIVAMDPLQLISFLRIEPGEIETAVIEGKKAAAIATLAPLIAANPTTTSLALTGTLAVDLADNEVFYIQDRRGDKYIVTIDGDHAAGVSSIAIDSINITRAFVDGVLRVPETRTYAGIEVLESQITLKVEYDEIIESINLSTEGIRISGSLISVNGLTLFAAQYDPSEKSAIYRQSSPPSFPYAGDAWYDTDDKTLWRYTGVTWEAVASDDLLWRHAADFTQIDGGKIYALSVTAASMAAGTITADKIAAGTITTTELSFTPVQDTDVIAKINASVEGLKITADRITLDGVVAVTDDLQSDGFVAGTSGWRLHGDDSVEFWLGSTVLIDESLGIRMTGTAEALEWRASLPSGTLVGKIFSPSTQGVIQMSGEYAGSDTIKATCWSFLEQFIVDVGATSEFIVGSGYCKVENDLEIDGDLNHDGANAGFYATAPVAQQTGVAVTAAGIHAALVALGLITA